MDFTRLRHLEAVDCLQRPRQLFMRVLRRWTQSASRRGSSAAPDSNTLPMRATPDERSVRENYKLPNPDFLQTAPPSLANSPQRPPAAAVRSPREHDYRPDSRAAVTTAPAVSGSGLYDYRPNSRAGSSASASHSHSALDSDRERIEQMRSNMMMTRRQSASMSNTSLRSTSQLAKSVEELSEDNVRIERMRSEMEALHMPPSDSPWNAGPLPLPNFWGNRMEPDEGPGSEADPLAPEPDSEYETAPEAEAEAEPATRPKQALSVENAHRFVHKTQVPQTQEFFGKQVPQQLQPELQTQEFFGEVDGPSPLQPAPAPIAQPRLSRMAPRSRAPIAVTSLRDLDIDDDDGDDDYEKFSTPAADSSPTATATSAASASAPASRSNPLAIFSADDEDDGDLL